MVGVDTAVFHGCVNFGATGAITGQCRAQGGAASRRPVETASKGDPDARRKAKELEEALHVLSSFDEGPDLVLYYKHLMVLNGDRKYALHINPTGVLTDAQRALAEDEEQYRPFRAWYSEWAK